MGYHGQVVGRARVPIIGRTGSRQAAILSHSEGNQNRLRSATVFRHPESAVFPHHTGPLTDEAKGQIYQDYRAGRPIEVLVKQYGRTKTSIYRVINEMRARRIAELPLEFMYNEEFEAKNADQVILGPMPVPETTPRAARVPSGLPRYLASLYEVPLLTREQEQHIFRKFNYLKFKAARLRDQVDPATAKGSSTTRR